MQYKITDTIKRGFKGTLSVYMNEEEYFDINIKKPLKEDRKVVSFIIDFLKKEFVESTDEEVVQARSQTMIAEFVTNLEKIFSDDDFKKVFGNITIFNKKK